MLPFDGVGQILAHLYLLLEDLNPDRAGDTSGEDGEQIPLHCRHLGSILGALNVREVGTTAQRPPEAPPANVNRRLCHTVAALHPFQRSLAIFLPPWLDGSTRAT